MQWTKPIMKKDLDSLNHLVSLAEDPNTRVTVLEELALNEASEVRAYVAANPSAPVELIDKLSRDEFWKVRMYAGGNKSIPIERLIQMVEEEEDEMIDSYLVEYLERRLHPSV